MRLNKTDLIALGVIGLSTITSVGLTSALVDDDHHVVHVDVDVRYEDERHLEGDDARHTKREAEGATVIRIRGDASEIEGTPQILVRQRTNSSLSMEGRPQPLIYVDGERYEGEASDLAPDDIERIEIVKGAAAVELFGDEAQGGVIQIFLKPSATNDPGR